MKRDRHQTAMEAPVELDSSSPFSNMATAGEGIFTSTLDSEIRDRETDQGLTLLPKIQSCDLLPRIAALHIPDELGALLRQFDLEGKGDQRRDHSLDHDLIRQDYKSIESARKRRRLTKEPSQPPEASSDGSLVAEKGSQDVPLIGSAAPGGVPSVAASQSRRDSGYGLSISDTAWDGMHPETPTLPDCSNGQDAVHLAHATPPTGQSPQISPLEDDSLWDIPDNDISSDSDFDDSRVPALPNVGQEVPGTTKYVSPYVLWDCDEPVPSIEKVLPKGQNEKKRKIPAWMRELSSRLSCPRCGAKCSGCLDNELKKLDIDESVSSEEYWRGQASSTSDRITRSSRQPSQSRKQTSHSNQSPDLDYLGSHIMTALESLAGCFPVTSLLATVGHYQQHQVTQLISEGLGYFETTAAFTSLEIPAPLQKSLDVLYIKYQNDEAFRNAIVKYLVQKLKLINDGKERMETQPPNVITERIEDDVNAEIDQLATLDEAKALLRKHYARYIAKINDRAMEIETLHDSSILQRAYNENIAELQELKERLSSLERELKLTTANLKEAVSSLPLRSIPARLDTDFSDFRIRIEQSITRYEQYIKENGTIKIKSIPKPFWVCPCGGLNDSILAKSTKLLNLQERKTCMACSSSNVVSCRRIKYIDAQEAIEIGGYKRRLASITSTTPAAPTFPPQTPPPRFRITLPSIEDQPNVDFMRAASFIPPILGQESSVNTDDLASLFDEYEVPHQQVKTAHVNQGRKWSAPASSCKRRKLTSPPGTQSTVAEGGFASMNTTRFLDGQPIGFQNGGQSQSQGAALNASQIHHSYLEQGTSFNTYQSQNSGLAHQVASHNFDNYHGQGTSVYPSQIYNNYLGHGAGQGEVIYISQNSNFNQRRGVDANAPLLPTISQAVSLSAQSPHLIDASRVGKSSKVAKSHPGFEISNNTAQLLRRELGGKQRDWMVTTAKGSASIPTIDLTNDEAIVEEDDNGLEADLEAAFDAEELRQAGEDDNGLEADLEAAFDAEELRQAQEDDNRLEADLEAAFNAEELQQAKEAAEFEEVEEGEGEEDDDHSSLWSEAT